MAQASRLEMLNGEAVEMAGQTNEACHLQLRSLFQMPAYSAYSAYSAYPAYSAYSAYGLISLTFLDFIDIRPCLLTKERQDQ